MITDVSTVEKFFDIPAELDVTDKPVKSFVVKPVKLSTIRAFVEKWHYSKSVRGMNCSHYFGLFSEGNLIGAMMYGRIAMRGVYKKYVNDESEIIELRRLCCIDKTPKNTESYFVGQTIKWLKNNSKFKKILSYADPHYGHGGIIYKATNFKYMGVTSKGKYIIDKDGKRRHDKTIRSSLIVNGIRVYKKHGIELKRQLETGEAKYIETAGKHIYIYELS
jgi:hypothetical protein